TNRLSAGEPDRLHPVSASFRNEADRKKLHIRLDGRIDDHSEQGCQRADPASRQSPKAQTGSQPDRLSAGQA
ncbi:MAG: hypothetical protein ACO3FE_19205, partial [Planctomycetaceae bacterium]